MRRSSFRAPERDSAERITHENWTYLHYKLVFMKGHITPCDHLIRLLLFILCFSVFSTSRRLYHGETIVMSTSTEEMIMRVHMDLTAYLMDKNNRSDTYLLHWWLHKQAFYPETCEKMVYEHVPKKKHSLNALAKLLRLTLQFCLADYSVKIW